MLAGDSNFVLSKCFAAGVGYPVRTKDGMVMKDNKSNMINPRADSFSLYLNFVADMILKGILPKNRLMKNVVHKVLAKVKPEFNPKSSNN
jgi:hypothetical protein